MVGIEVGDIIIEMNGQKIDKMNDVVLFIQKVGNIGEFLDLFIKCDK